MFSITTCVKCRYALFSDTIAINGTATAKGNFDITATCELGVSETLSYGYGTVSEGYQNDSCIVSDDSVSLSTKLLYPGARRFYTIKFTNTGTIDAVLDVNNVTRTDKLCVADNLEGNNKECKTEAGTALIYLGDYLGNAPVNSLAVEDPDGNLFVFRKGDVPDYINLTNGTCILKPGYSAYFYVYLSINHASSDQVYDAGEMYVEYNATIDFELIQSTQ